MERQYSDNMMKIEELCAKIKNFDNHVSNNKSKNEQDQDNDDADSLTLSKSKVDSRNTPYLYEKIQK